MSDQLEQMWDKILSRQPEEVRKAFHNLDILEQQAILEHLKCMANEPGWHIEQRISAQAALAALENPED
jgi:hypothetical protein